MVKQNAAIEIPIKIAEGIAMLDLNLVKINPCTIAVQRAPIASMIKSF